MGITGERDKRGGRRARDGVAELDMVRRMGAEISLSVMAGLDPAIQAPLRSRISYLFRRRQCMVGRVKAGHDEAAAPILARMRSSPALTDSASVQSHIGRV